METPLQMFCSSTWSLVSGQVLPYASDWLSLPASYQWYSCFPKSSALDQWTSWSWIRRRECRRSALELPVVQDPVSVSFPCMSSHLHSWIVWLQPCQLSTHIPPWHRSWTARRPFSFWVRRSCSSTDSDGPFLKYSDHKYCNGETLVASHISTCCTSWPSCLWSAT